MSKPILCLDFDGVLHSYASGWQGADKIPDPPVRGAMAFLEAVIRDGRMAPAIHSSRSHVPGGITAMQAWLEAAFVEHFRQQPERSGWLWSPATAGDIARSYAFDAIAWPTEKPPAFVTLDDRALTFDGRWPIVDTLLMFRPWYR